MISDSNVLISLRVTLYDQLCDFGLARSLGKAPSSPSGDGGVEPDVEDSDTGHEVKLTEYVVTRWWRAPEVRPVVLAGVIPQRRSLV